MAYSPVPEANLSNSSNLSHLILEYHRKTALDRLLTTFMFNEPAQKDMIPKRQGRTIKFHRWGNFAASTTTKTEGAVGTSLSSPGTNTVSIQVSDYRDFITFSDLVIATAPDPIVDSNADLLGYRGGLSVDTITRNVLDDAASPTNQALLGTYFTVRDLRVHSTILLGRNCLPFEDGYFYTIAHPYVTFDIVNDPAAGGLVDIFKHTDPRDSGGNLIKMTQRAQPVITAANCKVVHSTNVTQPTGTTWRVYTFAKGAFGVADLEGYSPSRSTDPLKSGFNVKVKTFNGDNVADIEEVIGGAVMYKHVFGVKILDGPSGIGGTYRFITVSAPSSIVS